jgi:hypothetical protein
MDYELAVISKHLSHQQTSLIEKCLTAVDKNNVQDSGLTREHYEVAMESAALATNMLYPELTEAKAYSKMLGTEMGKRLYNGHYATYVAALNT